MVAFVFPGQGSQAVGMGKDLFPLFPELINQADEVLGYSLVDLCLNDKDQKLNQTQFTQPALYTVNALSYLQKTQDGENIPNYLAGHSLGEYNALFAAGVFDFLTGLKLVQKRGELMGQAHDGAMAAVIGLGAEKIRQTLKAHQLANVFLANDNTYQQQVISGDRAEMEKAQAIFSGIEEEVRVIPLKVSGAFHSALMADAQQEFRTFLSQFSFQALKIPVIANVTAKPYPANETAHLLAEQITHPVRWVETIEYLLAQGEADFQEVGPGKVLAGLLRRIRNHQ